MRSIRMRALALLLFCGGTGLRLRAQETPPVKSLDHVGSGELYRVVDGGLVPLPVLTMDVRIEVAGNLVRGVVTQRFANPTGEVIDALYAFPLPEHAAVDGMEMRIGERRITAVVKEREEARRTYETAMQEGKKAALVEQERPNLFRSRVANVNPGEEVEVILSYLEEVSWRDGSMGFAVPLTFTPRYTPASAGESAPRSSEASPEGPLVSSSAQSVPKAKLRVRIDHGSIVEGIASGSHPLRLTTDGDGTIVEPKENPVLADRDFLLTWRIRRSAEPAAAAYVEERPEGRYALVMIVPPALAEGEARWPTDTIFLVDVSGSMEGPSIDAAKRALLQALDRLEPGDRFDLIAFHSENWAFRDSLERVDPEAIRQARAWVESLEPGGGTEIVPALVRALERMKSEPGDRSRARRVILLTDGAVGNEDEAFREVTSRLGETRLHVIGIGNAPNRYLMRKLAEVGRGTSEFLDQRSDIAARMEGFYRKIDRPAMSDLAIQVDGAVASEVHPEHLPDLYLGDPLVVSLKLSGARDGRLRLRGLVLGRPVETIVPLGADATEGSGIATRWARAKVDSLLDSLQEGSVPSDVRAAVIGLATEFHLVTPFTSLVAVEETPTAEGPAAQKTVPNCLPAGSTLDCALPQGGTSGPLTLLLGTALLSIGFVLHWIAKLRWVRS